MRRFVVLILACVVLCAGAATSTGSARAADEPLMHTVYKGQRLGSIAKRYNVSIDALCQANGIKRTDVIRPGQKLVIPGRTVKRKTRAKRDSDSDDTPARAKRAKKERAKEDRARREPGKPKTHEVYRGQRLGSIAKRYRVSINAICHANDIGRTDPIRPGQVLLIPHRDDEDGSYARKLRLAGDYDHELEGDDRAKRRSETRPKKREKSWEKYEKPPWRRGYIHLVGFNETWKGYVIGPENQILGNASQQIAQVMAAHGDDRPGIHPRLIRLIAKVSDTFGGRAIRVVSGYRERSYAAASRHRLGHALDFSIPGVPNEVLRDYLRTLDNVGVGYYPNSSFVHLDVREYNAYWIDYSGPGEAPRYRRRSAGRSTGGGDES